MLPTGRKNPAPAQLAACIAAFKQKRTAESNVYAVSTSAPQTKRIAELDSERDPMLKQVKDIIRTMAGMDIFPEKKAAAELLLESMKPYPYLDPAAEYEAETNAINQWAEAIQQSLKLTAAVATLGLTDTLASLVSKTAEKKAKEAGGLAVALKGVIVKPTDVVDVEKEYQLVPYSE